VSEAPGVPPPVIGRRWATPLQTPRGAAQRPVISPVHSAMMRDKEGWEGYEGGAKKKQSDRRSGPETEENGSLVVYGVPSPTNPPAPTPTDQRVRNVRTRLPETRAEGS
jgi:hypothetical protein